MTKKEKIGLSFFIACFVIIVEVMHKKVGGHLSGGRFSHPHTWTELKEFIPDFVIFFIIAFIGMSIYQLIGKEEDMICPNCEEGFKSSDYKTAICPNCGTTGEKLEGFYKRQPELLNKKN